MPKPTRLPKACIFDLDGTLVDSLADIAESLNHSLGLLGLPERPVLDYRYLVGEGIPKLCDRLIGETHPNLIPRLIDLARSFYRLRPLVKTCPYRGIAAVVASLRSRGVKLAVLSNKPHEMAVRVVRAYWPDTFSAIYGYQEEGLRKPDPYFVHRICRELGVSEAETWVIGDTPTDIETARRSGAVPIGVSWGFRSRADLVPGAVWIVDVPEELLI